MAIKYLNELKIRQVDSEGEPGIHQLKLRSGALDMTNIGSNITVAWANVSGKPATATRWPTWAEVTSKPSTFTPSAHNQAWSTITNPPATATRWPAWSEVTGKPADNQFPNTAQALGASQNLNNYTTPGFYYQNLNANAGNGSNYPAAVAGTLVVTKDAGVTQMYYAYDGSGVYYRHYYSTWGSWQNLLKPTWANVSSKPTTATRWPTWSEVTGKPSTFAPSSHTHSGTSTTGTYTTHTTAHGYIRLGPMNTSYAHVYTDRASFYFDKPIRVNGTLVSLTDHTHSRSQTQLRGATSIAQGGNYSLSQSILNFDLIIIHYSTAYNSSTGAFNSDTVTLYPHGHPTSGANPFSIGYGGTGRWVTWQFTSTTNLNCRTLVNPGTTPRIRAVYGIKFTA